jgi:hypothetical protein
MDGTGFFYFTDETPHFTVTGLHIERSGLA